MTVLVFDSGVGGLSVLREARVILPGRRIVYVGDDAGFPYGEWPEAPLVERIVGLFERYLATHDATLGIVACNTASTLIMPALRARFDIPFVGTVPPIKPAAERTASGLVSMLATPGTINRPYVTQLIETHADAVEVNLVGSTRLARLAEQHMRGHAIDLALLADEIRPCFVERHGRRTDIVILGCTHYPFLVHEMRKLAPWPVDWLEPAEAIARRALSLIGHVEERDVSDPDIEPDIAMMTSGMPDAPLRRLLSGFGLQVRPPIDEIECDGLSSRDVKVPVAAWRSSETPPILSADDSAPGVLERHDVRYLVVHCSATPDDVDIGAREIHAMHLGFGWHGIGYHRVIRRDGRVETGRPDCWIGAHVLGHNDSSLGVCLIGCDHFTEAQFESLEMQLRAWQARCPHAVICGHRDFAYTEKTCPNFDVVAWCVQRGLPSEPTLHDVPS